MVLISKGIRMALVKKIDRLLISSFIPPFIVTFMIAIFVLVMQTLWIYIDDIAGKGLGMFLLIELLAYRSVSLIPLALPLAILISSVMVLGNLAERYELSSIKSAGVSLTRVMRPLLLVGILSALFSYYCAVYLIPVSNLKFGSRMFDISQQKPTLRLEQGIFNDDFAGYAIHIGKKLGDGRSIEDVLIYDHREANQGRLSQIIAEKGEMYATADGQYFVMKLKNGYQYVEPGPSSSNRGTPFITTAFENWTKVFDLGEFQLTRTNEALFKHNRSMLSVNELGDAIDSLNLRILKSKKNFSNQLTTYYSFLEKDSTFIDPLPKNRPGPSDVDSLERLEELRIEAENADSTKIESTDTSTISGNQAKGARNQPKVLPIAQVQVGKTKPKLLNQSPRKTPKVNRPRTYLRQYYDKILPQSVEKPLEEYERFSELFSDTDVKKLVSKAKSSVRSIKGQSEATNRRVENLRENREKHIYDQHTKYSNTDVCILFIFIGAPMGAIIRKGGFGFPILVAIIFFMEFVILTIMCRKIAETFVITAEAAAWIPCMVLFPQGLTLTIKAMNDSKFIDIQKYFTFFGKLYKRTRKLEKITNEVPSNT